MKDSIQKGTICVEDLEIGMSRMLERKITQNDILLFSKVSGDQNPVHLDDEYAQQTIFGRRIAHGMLTASLISAVIAEQLPGHGTVYLSQTLKFIRPVLPGQLITTKVAHIWVHWPLLAGHLVIMLELATTITFGVDQVYGALTKSITGGRGL